MRQVVAELGADREPRGRVLEHLLDALPLLRELEASARAQVLARQRVALGVVDVLAPVAVGVGRLDELVLLAEIRDGRQAAAADRQRQVAVLLDARRRDPAAQVRAAAGGLQQVAARVVLVVDDETEPGDLGPHDALGAVARLVGERDRAYLARLGVHFRHLRELAREVVAEDQAVAVRLLDVVEARQGDEPSCDSKWWTLPALSVKR